MAGWQFAKNLLVMAGVTYLIRALPFLIFRKKIENQFILSILYYAPYAILSAMTFPDILYATGNFYSAGAGLVVTLAAALCNRPMVVVAVLGSIAAIAVQLLFALF